MRPPYVNYISNPYVNFSFHNFFVPSHTTSSWRLLNQLFVQCMPTSLQPIIIFFLLEIESWQSWKRMHQCHNFLSCDNARKWKSAKQIPKNRHGSFLKKDNFHKFKPFVINKKSVDRKRKLLISFHKNRKQLWTLLSFMKYFQHSIS